MNHRMTVSGVLIEVCRTINLFQVDLSMQPLLICLLCGHQRIAFHQSVLSMHNGWKSFDESCSCNKLGDLEGHLMIMVVLR